MKPKTNFTEFTKKVYSAVKRIRKGRVVTYKDIAKAIGITNAYRAVGNALNKNTDYAIPCHRIIKSDMSVGGFRKGISKKTALLRSEGIVIKNGKVVIKGKL